MPPAVTVTRGGKAGMMAGAGFSPLRPYLCAATILILSAGSAATAATAPVRPTRVEGAVSMSKAVRDDAGKVVGSVTSTPAKAVLYIAGSSLTITKGRYGVDLLPGSYPYLFEATEKVKPKRAKEITERYWAMGSVRIDPAGPAQITVDTQMVLVEDSQAFCRTCHPDIRITLGQVQSCHHSTGKPLKELYKKPFAKSGLTLEGNLMVCITCHTPHIAIKTKKFLRRTMDRNELCVQCHV